jgi:hypothetical protein
MTQAQLDELSIFEARAIFKTHSIAVHDPTVLDAASPTFQELLCDVMLSGLGGYVQVHGKLGFRYWRLVCRVFIAFSRSWSPE